MNWPWPNFPRSEVACKHCGVAMVVPDAMNKLQYLRDLMERPLTINSAYRCPVHNAKVGGSKTSFHLRGQAFDIAFTEGINKAELRFAAEKAGFTGFGVYPTFLHVDTGPAREWVGK